MANLIYNSFKDELATGFNYTTDTIKVLLVSSSYVANQDTHITKDDIDTLAVEVTGTGYIDGGATLQGKTTNVNITDNRAEYDADNTVWVEATITARYAIVYKDTGEALTSPLICSVDLGAERGSVSDDFTIVWATSGVFYVG